MECSNCAKAECSCSGGQALASSDLQYPLGHQAGTHLAATNVYGSLTPPPEVCEDPLADVFGSFDQRFMIEGSDQLKQTAEEPSDIPRLRSLHVTNGYREGIAQGKESSVQAGFDEGYALGAEIGMCAGRLLGILACHASTPNTVNHSVSGAGSRTLAQLLESARDGLNAEKLFSESYFDEYGLWKFPVNGSEAESDITFRQVAASHPLITKWTGIIEEIVQTQGQPVVMMGAIANG